MKKSFKYLKEYKLVLGEHNPSVSVRDWLDIGLKDFEIKVTVKWKII